MGNHNPKFEERRTFQWPKGQTMVGEILNRYTHIYQPGERMCLGLVSSPCYSTGALLFPFKDANII